MSKLNMDTHLGYDVYGSEDVQLTTNTGINVSYMTYDNSVCPTVAVQTFMKAAGQDVHSEPCGETEQSKLYANLIAEEFDEFVEALDHSNDAEQLDACVDMIWVIVAYMASRGWDYNAAWGEVSKTNLSKIDPNTGKCIKREDGKILKPEGWEEPNFEQFV